jgi:polyisoprenoid-binding protein YceI
MAQRGRLPEGHLRGDFGEAAGRATGYEAAGSLTIKGASQNVVAPFTLTEAAGTRIVEGQFTMKRLQYKIGEGAWAETDTVADDVLVRFRFALPAK